MKTTALALLVFSALMVPSLAQDSSAPAGAAAPADIVAARRQVMAVIGTQMAPIQAAIADGNGDLTALAPRAEAVAGLMAAFPHLFGANTDPSKPDAAELATDAAPAIWQDFPAFTAFANSSLHAATAAATAADLQEFLILAEALDQTCTDCHAQFLEYSMPGF
jgi:cytochrome c556